MMNYQVKYRQWLTEEVFGTAIHEELSALTDEKEIEERFYCELEFGTGGLRGIMGAGTNRMNQFTVGKATAGVGNYLLDTYGMTVCKEKGVVIGYDTRNNSKYFAQVTADVFSGMGIKVFLYENARPTPQLSFSVKYFQAIAGVMITASHNPKEYNGYKVYDEFGCQLVPAQVKQVIPYIKRVVDYHAINFAGNDSLIVKIDATDEFVDAVIRQNLYHDRGAKQRLKIVYTPLHGTGRIPVEKALQRDGFTQLFEVLEQSDSNGDFPTVISPNPEDRRALEYGIYLAKQINADIVLGTDPDSDRVGISVKDQNGDFQLLTGNQVGALLMDFILAHIDMDKYPKPAVVKTIVTSELGASIACAHGITVFSTLTGFKFIGEKISQFSQAKRDHISEKMFDFLFGYEESYGYLSGTYAQDKDAVSASLLICEMAAEAKSKGMTLLDKIDALYKKYGYYCDALDSFTLNGKEGIEKINMIMETLRSDSPFEKTKSVIDYKHSVGAEPGFGVLPTSNVLKYILEDDSWVAIRPSGTESKIKIYYSIKGNSALDAERRLTRIRDIIKTATGLEEK